MTHGHGPDAGTSKDASSTNQGKPEHTSDVANRPSRADLSQFLTGQSSDTTNTKQTSMPEEAGKQSDGKLAQQNNLASATDVASRATRADLSTFSGKQSPDTANNASKPEITHHAERRDNTTPSHIHGAQLHGDITSGVVSANSANLIASNAETKMSEKSNPGSGNIHDRTPENAQIGGQVDQTTLGNQLEKVIGSSKAEVNPTISNLKPEASVSFLKDNARAPEGPSQVEESFNKGLIKEAQEHIESKLSSFIVEKIAGKVMSDFVENLSIFTKVAKYQVEFLLELAKANDAGIKEGCRNKYISEYATAVAHLTGANPGHWAETYSKEPHDGLKRLVSNIPPMTLDPGGYIRSMNAIASTARREALRAVIQLGEKGAQEFNNKYPDYEARRQVILKEFYSGGQ